MRESMQLNKQNYIDQMKMESELLFVFDCIKKN